MSEPPKRQPPSASHGGTTARRGTPVPVHLSNQGRTWGAIALVVAGPVLWSAHFLLVYLVVEAGCTGSGPGLRSFAPPVPAVVTLVATAVAAVACLTTAAVAHRRWRARRREPAEGGGLEPVDRGGSLAFAALLLSLLGAVQVLFVGLPALVLPAC